ncbi:DUF2953 domain-containing protein [Cytobacillus sp. FJAT-54145]|uniref:DUF2953 domain-containing protein n=1 Tax=Cytobacillus spartinae TaxID=3299023 RepID=A0ABW6KLQ3_9BACI
MSYYHAQDNDDLVIKFKALFGLIQYKIKVPLIKLDENSASIVVKEKVEQGPQEKNIQSEKRKITPNEMLKSFSDMRELLNHVVALHTIIRKFLKKVTVKNLEWQSVIGVGDAAYTGMITGAFWAIKGSIVGLVSNYMKVKVVPNIMITPNFQQAISQTSLKCMIEFRIGHAILAGIKLFKFWKGGKPRFKTKPLSVLSGDKTKSV